MTTHNLTTPEAVRFLDQLAALLTPVEYVKMLMLLGGRVGTLAESYGREHPNEPGGRPLAKVYTLDGKPSKFKSRKQQRKVIMLYKEHKAPYKRTGFLGNSITHKVEIQGDKALVVVGSNSDHAEVTIGNEEQQSHYHKETGWQSLDKSIFERRADLQQEVVNAAGGWLSGYMRGIR